MASDHIYYIFISLVNNPDLNKFVDIFHIFDVEANPGSISSGWFIRCLIRKFIVNTIRT